MTHRYKIASHFCEISFAEPHNTSALLPSFAPFETTEEGTLLFQLTVDDSHQWVETGEEVGQFDCGGNNFGVYHSTDGTYRFELANECHLLCATLETDATFKKCTVALKATGHNDREFGLNNAIMLVYAFASAPYGTLLMHSSVVRNNGKGYLFLGLSGTGKSTHTRLWLQHIDGSDLMNDDNPVLRVDDEGVTVYGSPWSGKTPCYRNISAPVGALVQLQQRPENSIRSMKVLECFASMLPSISTMKWDKRIYTQHCDTITRMLQHVPMYHLGCLPDEEAARLSHETITTEH